MNGNAAGIAGLPFEMPAGFPPNRNPFNTLAHGGAGLTRINTGWAVVPQTRLPSPAGCPMTRLHSFDRAQLLDCAHGGLFGEGNARLPSPPMLMFDRITAVEPDTGRYGKGLLCAELDIRPDLWFFGCHFSGDPVMPGCLGLDAMWQLAGFYLPWLGEPGRGRALGVGEVKFSGQVLPDARLVRYEIHVRRVMRGKLALVIADGDTFVDGRKIYVAKDLRVGLFQSTEGF
jgi:3-hydroxyacyl-[acyl-carrier protein] dehydratase / trans-2-decenoyl-[acyl-carrier protein] isomerase